MVFQSKYYDMETPPPPLLILCVLSKYHITPLLFNASRKSTWSYGYMAISEALTVGIGTELLNSRSLSTKLMDKFEHQSFTELSRATYILAGSFWWHRSLSRMPRTWCGPCVAFHSIFIRHIPPWAGRWREVKHFQRFQSWCSYIWDSTDS